MQKAPGEEAGGLALAAARDAEKDDLVIQEAVTIEDPKIEACVRKNSEESSTQWTTGIAEVQPPIKSAGEKLCCSRNEEGTPQVLPHPIHWDSWEMKLCALAALAAATTSSAVASSFPNRMFSRMLVANSAGSWFTSPICARSHFSRSRRMSTPSTVTSPANGS
uniref:Uncharacterized protein n=1 Tax=Oryza meridionalis TaxID=40149 RepID=A0A0E0CH16_9ORYZ